MPITLASNIASLRAQRQLDGTSRALENIYARLSTGQRINKPSDDAAGLAISAGLNADARVYTQGIRNVNDGVSLLNTAEGALTQLTNIVTRQKELAEQASNGVYSTSQRVALNKEANALVKEYNRIVRSTSFNSQSIIDGTGDSFSVQQGYGSNESTLIALSQGFGTAAGTGTFASSANPLNSALTFASAAGDFDGDGNSDFVSIENVTNMVFFLKGNGDGTFRAEVSYSTGLSVGGVTALALGDVNNDGKLDVVTTSSTGRVSILLGNGTGTFRAATTISSAAGAVSPADIQIRDLNNDGNLDLITTDTGAGAVNIFLGCGNGSFRTAASYNIGTSAISSAVGDFNGDGIADLAAGTSTGFSVILGNADGSFSARTIYAIGSAGGDITTGDFNGDGIADIAVGHPATGKIFISFGNGNGTFLASSSYTGGSTVTSIVAADFNGDGITDVATTDGISIYTLLGNSNGSFRAALQKGGQSASSLAVSDFNNDGINDLLTTENFDWVAVNLGVADNTGRRNNFQYDLDLLTSPTARQSLTVLSGYLTRVSTELGKIGAYQSRLASSISNLQTRKLNYQEAASSILDADIAQESANLVSKKILQQSGVAILAQANSQTKIALTLLPGQGK